MWIMNGVVDRMPCVDHEWGGDRMPCVDHEWGGDRMEGRGGVSSG